MEYGKALPVSVGSKRAAVIEILSKCRETYSYGYLQQVAREVNCSKQYVRQIAQELGLRFLPQEEHKCIDCGKKIHSGSLRCLECWSQTCRIPNARCDYCGKPIHIRKYAETHHKLHFCNKKCQGGWLGKHANRRNQRKGGSITAHCAYCGKEIRVADSKLREKNFCSYHCSILYYRCK